MTRIWIWIADDNRFAANARLNPRKIVFHASICTSCVFVVCNTWGKKKRIKNQYFKTFKLLISPPSYSFSANHFPYPILFFSRYTILPVPLHVLFLNTDTFKMSLSPISEHSVKVSSFDKAADVAYKFIAQSVTQLIDRFVCRKLQTNLGRRVFIVIRKIYIINTSEGHVI